MSARLSVVCCLLAPPLPICQSCQNTSLSVSTPSCCCQRQVYILPFLPLVSSRSTLCRPNFLRMLLFCGFLLRLISGLNHPLAPQIWRWGGSGVREGNDGTQSTKLEEGIQIVKYTLYWTLPTWDAVQKVPQTVTVRKFSLALWHGSLLQLEVAREMQTINCSCKIVSFRDRCSIMVVNLSKRYRKQCNVRAG